jgi:multiple antibiotic resistance protein
MVKNIFLSFIPTRRAGALSQQVFVAVDAVGVLPTRRAGVLSQQVFVSLTAGMAEKEKTKIIAQSVVTAFPLRRGRTAAKCLAIGFIFLGKAVFPAASSAQHGEKVLGITMGDFMIAGGAILFCLAITDIINPVKERRIPGQELGAVPLGTPLIVGPAVLTTSMVIISQYGLAATLISVLVNIVLAGVIFSSSSVLLKVLGEAGSKALSKIMSLLLAAIAVMLARKGLAQFIGQG